MELLGHGDGTFEPEQWFVTGSNSSFLALTDVNGDGHPDIVTASYDTVGVILHK